MSGDGQLSRIVNLSASDDDRRPHTGKETSLAARLSRVLGFHGDLAREWNEKEAAFAANPCVP